MDLWSFFVFIGFPFHRRPAGSRQRRTDAMPGYSGSAAVLDEEAAQAAFSPPPRDRSVSPVAYGNGGPTVGRRRTSPVMDSSRCPEAAACITLLTRRG